MKRYYWNRKHATLFIYDRLISNIKAIAWTRDADAAEKIVAGLNALDTGK